MKNYKITRIAECPEYTEKAAKWFHEKWDVPISAYKESMEACVREKSKVPQWYIVMDESENIIAGAGIIENDFHDRKGLTPNLCALFVEEKYRNRGIAKKLLDFAREETSRMGYEKLYLITEHTEFYERCGWNFLTMVSEDGGGEVRMYAAQTQ